MANPENVLQETLVTLFYLLVNVDGEVNYQELAIGKKMAKAERIAPQLFERWLSQLYEKKESSILDECLHKLKTLKRQEQQYCMAWVTTIAKSDGYIAKKEGKLIQNTFIEQLNLTYQDTVALQQIIIKKIRD